MLPTTLAKLFQLDPIRRGLPVLRCRVIALFAITALHRNNFSGHSTQLLASSCSLLATVFLLVILSEALLASRRTPARRAMRPRLGRTPKPRVRRASLLNNLCDRAGAHRVAAFPNRKPQALF